MNFRRLPAFMLLAAAPLWAQESGPDSLSPAGSARYLVDLKVQENTYAQNHSVSYNRLMYGRLHVSARDDLNRKTIIAEHGALSQQQGNVALNVQYRMNDRLNVGGRMQESVNSDGLRTDGTNDYNFRAAWLTPDSNAVTQSLGSVSEERLNERDWGVKYTTTAAWRLPGSGNGDIRLHGSYTGDNLRWGGNSLNAGGSFFRRYQAGSTVRLKYDFSRDIKRNTRASAGGGNSFSTESNGQDAGIVIGYSLGNAQLDLHGDLRRRDAVTGGHTGYAGTIDFDERYLAFGTDIRRMRLGTAAVTGGFEMSSTGTAYPDETRNEKDAVVSMNGSVRGENGLLDACYLTGNYKKSVLKDADGVDDRDNITVNAAAGMPVPSYGAVACTLSGDLSMRKTVYIHTSRSHNSRWNKLYRMGPRLRYRFFTWLTVEQNYAVSARYIENIIKDYYSGRDIKLVDDLQDRLTREFTVENGLRAQVFPGFTVLGDYDYSLEERAVFEGGLFESVFRRMPTGLTGNHAWRASFNWRPLRRLTVAPSYEFNRWHEDELAYDARKRGVSVEDSRQYRKHTARFMMEYALGRGSAKLNSVYTFKNLDGNYEEKKYIQFSLQLPLL